MKRFYIIIVIFITLKASAQQNGIRFENGITWEQVKEKARQENKYIFVDCYATWCKPCREMDEKVYPDKTVGQLVNDQFISVKVQMDSTKRDPESVRLLYPTAREFEKQYKIVALPTYLFFSANGDLVHKGMGSQDKQQFIQIASNASDPNRQLFTRLNAWTSGKISYETLPSLVKQLKQNNEDSLALIVARSYMIGYLDKLTHDQLFNPDYINFLGDNRKMIKTSDRIFSVYNSNRGRVDSLTKQKEYAKNLIRSIIVKDEILAPVQEAMKNGKKPDWGAIQKNLDKKYGKNFEVLEVMWTRVKYSYKTKNDWIETMQVVTNNWVKFREPFLNQGANVLDYLAMISCNYSSKRKTLEAAADWLKVAYDKNPDRYDLLWDIAVILNKASGKKNKQQAIILAEKYLDNLIVVTTDPNRSESERNDYLKVLPGWRTNVEKIKNGTYHSYFKMVERLTLEVE